MNSGGLETHYVDGVGLDLMELLRLLSTKCWDDRYALACLADSPHFYLRFRSLLCTIDLHVQLPSDTATSHSCRFLPY